MYPHVYHTASYSQVTDLRTQGFIQPLIHRKLTLFIQKFKLSFRTLTSSCIYQQMFFSTHYAGEILTLRFRNGEPWKKVFGPIFVYLNSISSDNEEILTLWTDAKEQVY